jgi:hypothetical protein
MPSTSSSARVAAALLLGVAATTAMSTVPALAAQIGPTQVAAKAGQPSPVAVRGTTVRKGDTLARGQAIVARAISLQGRERRRVRMACRPGWRLQGLALRALSDGIGFAVLPGEPSYVNRRTVTVRTFVLDRSRSTPADGVLYALCAQRA